MSDPMSSSEAAFDKSLSKYDEAARNFDDSPSKPAPDAGPSEVQLWAREYLDTPVALLLLYPIWFVVVKYTDVILNLHILTLAACVIAAGSSSPSRTTILRPPKLLVRR